MGGVDLVIISAGIGFINPELDLDKELETVATNVQGFITVANIAFRHFVRQGEGLFWMAPVQKAAAQIYWAIERKRSHAFVTKRWRLVAWMLKIMPDFLYHRI